MFKQPFKHFAFLEKDLIGIDTRTSRLVFLASASDFETDVSLPNLLIKKHPKITMYSNLIDAHVYVLKNWVIKYLASAKNFSTLKGELLPHIVKKQLSKPPKPQETNTSVVNAKDESDIFSYAQESEWQILIREASAFNGDSDVIRCYAYLAENDVSGVRVNTLPAYWSLNGQVSFVCFSVNFLINLLFVDHRKMAENNRQRNIAAKPHC